MALSAQTALLKREIEAKLASRISAALSPVPQQRPRLMSSGVSAIDELLGGGIPLGGITEPQRFGKLRTDLIGFRTAG